MISYSQWIRQLYSECIHICINKEMKFLHEVAVAWEFNRVWARILNSQESYFWGHRLTIISPSSENINYLKPIYRYIYILFN